jgi:peroxiredoxin Q/BCP
LQQESNKFVYLNTEIIIIGPEGPDTFKRYWQKHNLPFTGLPDPEKKALNLYDQQIKLLKFGRMPAQVIIGRQGIFRYMHYGNSISDIPNNVELFELLEEINVASFRDT